MKTDQDRDRLAAERDAARRALPLPALPVNERVAELVAQLSRELEREIAKPQPANWIDLRLRAALNEWRKATGTA